MAEEQTTDRRPWTRSTPSLVSHPVTVAAACRRIHFVLFGVTRFCSRVVVCDALSLQQEIFSYSNRQEQSCVLFPCVVSHALVASQHMSYRHNVLCAACSATTLLVCAVYLLRHVRSQVAVLPCRGAVAAVSCVLFVCVC